MGSAVVDLTPGPVKEWAIQTLGSMDKLFLAVAVLVVIAVVAAMAGSLETRRRPIGSAMFVAAGVLGGLAVLSRQGATAVDVLPTVVGTACGWRCCGCSAAGSGPSSRIPMVYPKSINPMPAGAGWSYTGYWASGW